LENRTHLSSFTAQTLAKMNSFFFVVGRPVLMYWMLRRAEKLATLTALECILMTDEAFPS